VTKFLLFPTDFFFEKRLEKSFSDPLPENPQDKPSTGGPVASGGNGGTNKPPFRGPGNVTPPQVAPGATVITGKFPSNGERPTVQQQPKWSGANQARPPVR